MKGGPPIEGSLDVYLGDSTHGSAAAERRLFFRRHDFSGNFARFSSCYDIFERTMRHRCCSLLAYCTHSLVTSTVSVHVLIVGIWPTKMPQAVSLLKEMQEAGLKPHPAAHQAALSAVAATEGHEAAMALLAAMKVRLIRHST